MKCTSCSVKLIANKKAYRAWKIVLQEDIDVASKFFKKNIQKDMLFCFKCRMIIARQKHSFKKQSREAVFSPLSPLSESSATTSSASSSVSSEYFNYNVDSEYTKIEMPCSTYSEKYCIVCGSTSNRMRIPRDVRFNAYIHYKLYIPPNIRCCSEHYLNNHLYTECYQLIKIISNISIVETDDLKWLLSKSSSIIRNNSLLNSFNNKLISDENCKSITGLKKDDFPACEKVDGTV